MIFADFGFAIRLMRQARKLSQSQLARRMECPRQYVSRIERRQAIPTANNFRRFALALDIDPVILATVATAKTKGMA